MPNCRDDPGLRGTFLTGSEVDNYADFPECESGYRFCMLPNANPDNYTNSGCTGGAGWKYPCTFDRIDDSKTFIPGKMIEEGQVGYRYCHKDLFSMNLSAHSPQPIKCGCMHVEDTFDNRVACCLKQDKTKCPFGFNSNTATSDTCDATIKKYCAMPQNYYKPECGCQRIPEPGLGNISMKCYLPSCQDPAAVQTNAQRAVSSCTLAICKQNININSLSSSGVDLSRVQFNQNCGNSPGGGAITSSPSDNGAPRSSPLDDPKHDDPAAGPSKFNLDRLSDSFLNGIGLESVTSRPTATRVAISAAIILGTAFAISRVL